MKTLWILVAGLAFWFDTAALCAALILDPFFAPVLTQPGGWITTVAVQPDGKLVVGGRFSGIGKKLWSGIARLNSDGTVDLTFNPGDGVRGSVGTVDVQADGKILVAGFFDRVAGSRRQNIARLNADGSLDPSFELSLKPFTRVLGILPTGKIIVSSGEEVVQLNSDGSIQSSFVIPSATAIAVQADGKILVADRRSMRLARLHANGTLDANFRMGEAGPDPALFVRTVRLTVQRDEKIVITGQFGSLDGIARPGLARLNPDGSLDLAFKPDLTGPGLPRVDQMTLQPDGNMLIIGSFEQVDGVNRPGIGRLLGDGRLDSTFDPKLRPSPSPGLTALMLQPDGKVIMMLNAEDRHIPETEIHQHLPPRIIRMTSDGNVDNTFQSIEMLSDSGVAALAVDDSDRIYVRGSFTRVNGVKRSLLARLNGKGELDKNFDPTEAFDLLWIIRVDEMLPLPDGRVLLAGATSFPGSSVSTLLIFRLDAGGKLDLSSRPYACSWCFNYERDTGIGPLIAQEDGGILFLDRTGYPTKVRRIRDGKLDTSFSLADEFSSITVFEAQKDGNILISGGLLTGDFGVARGNPDGRSENMFRLKLGGQYSGISAVAVQTDGKILIGGSFDRVGNSARSNLARLHRDGSLDLEFNPKLSGTVSSLFVQKDGRILVGEFFRTADGLEFVWLNQDGTTIENASSRLEFGLNAGPPYTLAQQGHTILMAGNFGWVNQDRRRFGLLRLVPGPILSPPVLLSQEMFALKIYGDSGWNYQIESSTDLRTWMPLRNIASTGYITEFGDLSLRKGSREFYRVVSGN